MNKKALLGEEMLIAIGAALLTFLIAGSLVFFVGRYLTIKADVFPMEASILAQRSLYSQNALAYFDENTQRAYPGIVDAELLKNPAVAEPRLLKAISYGAEQKYIAAKITIDTYAIYYNKPMYDSWLPKLGLKGAGATREMTFAKYILVKEGAKLTPAVAKISVLQPGGAA